MQTAVDDYVIITHIFSKKPNDLRGILLIIDLINDIVFKITSGNWKDTYKCWECGQEKHWLDGNESGIVNKYNAKKEKYCGC